MSVYQEKYHDNDESEKKLGRNAFSSLESNERRKEQRSQISNFRKVSNINNFKISIYLNSHDNKFATEKNACIELAASIIVIIYHHRCHVNSFHATTS